MTSKYHNQRVAFEGHWFDSQRELAIWVQLRALQSAGAIQDLQRQFPIRCTVNPFRVDLDYQLVTSYIADYVWMENGKQIVGDAKGFKTPVYRLKKKLVQALFGVEIQEL